MKLPRPTTNTSRTLLLRKVIPLVFYLLLALFLFLYLRTIDFSKFKDITFDWPPVLFGTLLAILFRYEGTYIWLVILKGLGAKNLNDKPGLAYVYAKSWLGRYIPGTAPWILGKIYFASRHGISKNKLAISSLLEGGLQITVIMIVALVLLFFDKRLDVVDQKFKFLMLITAAICVIAMIPPLFNKIISIAYKILRRKNIDESDLAGNMVILKGSFLYLIGAFINGLSYYYLVKGFYPEIDFKDSLLIVGAISLASSASMLAFFAPSGIGVREGILLTLMSFIMPTETALLITIVSRLWSIVCDGLFFAIALIVMKLHTKK